MSRRLRVLLVDDDAAFLRLHGRGLGRSVDVECANSAAKALDLFMHSPFDVVLTDFEMTPGEDGLWLLERVRAITPTTRRVMTSARPIEMFSPSIRSGLVQAFVAKPASIDEMLASCCRRPLRERADDALGAPQ